MISFVAKWKPMKEVPVLTTQQIAAELRVSATTVRDYADQGLIPCSRTLKGHRRYVLEDVREAVNRVRGWELEPLGPGDPPRLDSPGQAPLRLATGEWRPAIDAASITDSINATGRPDELNIPFLGIRGSSRFAIGEGARV